MDDATADLMDRFYCSKVELDDRRPLWDSDMDQIERWPSTSVDHTAAVARRFTDLADEARSLLDTAGAGIGDGGGRPVPAATTASLLTVRDAAALQAALADLTAEVSWAHPLTGLHAHLHWAVNDFPLRTAEHGERYLDKIARFPDAVGELTARLSVAATRGRGPITSHATMAAARIERQLATDVADDPVMAQAPPSELDEEAAARWRERLADVVTNRLRPGLALLAATLRETCAPAGRDDDHCGLVHRPDGEGDYLALLRGFTTPDAQPQQVHEIGLAQLERLEDEYARIGERALGTSDPADVRRRLVEDPDLRCSTAEEVVERATRLHARAVEQAGDWFSRTPAARCVVRPTEHGAIGFYSRPAEDGSRPAAFYLNTSEPNVWGANLAATVFHEGIPGHHYQLALAMETDGLHPVHRRMSLAAFSEGWALYAERLADEIGLYETDLDRLGMLTADSMRACRLVVDTGMHALGWGRTRAIEFMLANAPMGRTEISAEIDRYIGWPGQATSYMTGRMEIERLRADAERRLGEQFTIRGFHDVVLSRGMVSLPALRVLVEQWDGAAA